MKRSRALILTLCLVSVAAGLSQTNFARTVSGYRWWPIGPAPGPGLFPGSAAGRVTSIAVNPMNQDDVWIGAAGGGVWHWDYVRHKWFAMSDDEASLAIGSIALAACDPNKCSTVYAGTGENALRRDTYYGAGLLVGTFDGTATQWVLRKGQPYDFTHGSIYNVVLDPSTSGAGQVIYLTLSSGSTASSSESTVTAPAPLGGYGIYKSTNAGVSWSKILPGKPTDLEIDPAHPNTLYAGLSHAGIFRSTDGGTTWCPLEPGITQPAACTVNTFNSPLPNPLLTVFDHVEIALDPTPNQTRLHLYASFGMCPDPWSSPCRPAFYESTDGGDTWGLLFSGSMSYTTTNYFPDCPDAYSRYTHALTVDPADPNTFFSGGVRLCKFDRVNARFDPADVFSSIHCSDLEASTCIHPDHHAVVFAPSDPMHQRVYDANDGGVAQSTDGGATWTPMVQNLGVMEFQSLSGSFFQTVNVFGGLQDNGALDWDGGKSWTLFQGISDGGFSIMAPHGVTIGRYVTTAPIFYADQDIHPVRSFNGQNPMPDPNGPPAYDVGLIPTQFRSFYPPFMTTLPVQFFGTQWVYRSNDEASTWTLVSPFLATGDPLQGAFPGSGTFPDKDTITAIATHPSDSTHIYAGSYLGRLTYTTSPCSSPSCWHDATVGPPVSPITRLAVDPLVTFQDTAYATMSAFFSGMHVYKSTNGGDTWAQTPGHPDLDGVPINTISIDPSASSPNNLWIGTDKGVYRSDNGGASWYRFSLGLPNVPVYEILIDTLHDRAFAATHGRGVYILTTPMIEHHGYIINGKVVFLSATGNGFGPGQRCTLEVLRQDGSVCAAGANDALGGVIGTDSDGSLVSSRSGSFASLPLVSVCAQGRCLGTDVKNCTSPTNPMTSLETSCGNQVVTTSIVPAAEAPDPVSGVFTLTRLMGGSGGTLQLMPSMQSMNGSTRLLCSVGVPFAGADSTTAVLTRATDAINSDPTCQAGGVTAMLQPPFLPEGGEDQFPQPAALRLQAPGLVGGELIPGVSAPPGQAADVCLDFSNIGESSASRLHGLKLRFSTPPAGAAGGSLTLTERSGLGDCSIRVALPAGAQPPDVAQAVASAFQAPGIPGPSVACTSDSNPRDVVSHGDSVTTALASTIDICVNDAGVGVTMVPQDVCSADGDCDDANPCTLDVCSPSTGQCQNTSLPNGQPCEDANPCTVGGTCQSGSCGAPVNCNDGNACTLDSCNTTTGACAHAAVSCDDGNPCTTDSCSPASGACAFAPMPGAACDDGNSCTIGDSCMTSPGNPVPVCRGNPKCVDSDPCTPDLCDQTTGACINSPILCDDANPCTVDTCMGGSCVSTPITGACDDRDRCTVSDTCVSGPSGPPICTGTPVGCDDGDTCTVDICDPVTGGCTHAPVAGQDVNLMFTDSTILTWSADPGVTSYDTYRGTIPSQGLASRPPAASIYDHACFESGDSHGDGDLVSTDPAVPPPGTAYYYLVSTRSACGEGPLGEDSNTTPISNPSPCSAL